MQELEPRPYLSLTQLARLHRSRATTRDAVIKEARRRSGPAAIFYRDARRAIAQYMVERKKSVLRDAIGGVLKNPGGTSDWHITRTLCQATAMKRVLAARPPENLEEAGSRLRVRPMRVLEVEGVRLSVGAEVLHAYARGRLAGVGATKLVFRKNEIISDAEGALMGAVLFRWLDQDDTLRASASYSYIFDVFGGRYIPAPRNHARIMREVQALCREVALKWGVL